MSHVTHFNDVVDGLSEPWSPRVLAQVNDHFVKVAKVEGEFTWHAHENSDEMFWVIEGELVIEYEDSTVALGPGDLHVVPRGKRHRPRADNECKIVLVEAAETKHTGAEVTAHTKTIEEQLVGFRSGQDGQ
ncbi:MAG: cupin domain-containing protein [Myxococcota bacterium]